MIPEFDLANRRILITGAASGIGSEFASLASEAGARLALFDINASALAARSESLKPNSVAAAIPVDLTNWESVERAVGEAHAALGGFDVVLNVAGWSKPGAFWEQPMDIWRKIIDINVWSTLHVCRAVSPILMAQKSGTIINVSSDAGRVGNKGESVYAATKSAIIGLTKSLAREFATYQVTVNCVCPGPTMTPLLQTNMGTNFNLIEKMIKAIPLKRVGVPRDPALVMAFLASSAAAYMTGQVISVNGGLNMVD